MPYTGPDDSNLPKYVQRLSDKKREQWVTIFNDTIERGDGEQRAFQNANDVVNVKSYTSDCKLPEKTTLLRYKVFSMVCSNGHKQNAGDVCNECGEKLERKLIDRTMACVGSSEKCNHDQCTNCASWEFNVKDHKFYYCDHHMAGALSVFERHGLQINDKKEIEPGRWIELSTTKEYEDTAIVALVPTEEIANAIAINGDGALPPSELHVTMAYLGDVSQFDRDKTLSMLREHAHNTQPIAAKLNGVTRFTETHKPNEHAVVLNVDAPEIETLRRDLVDMFGLNSDTHGFTPHMTLSYIPSDSDGLPDVILPEDPVDFDALWVWWGEERYRFPFGSEGQKGKFVTIEGRPVFVGGPGAGGGGASGGGGNTTDNEETISISGNTTNIEMFNKVSDALDGKPFGKAVLVNIVNEDTGQSIQTHIVQHTLRGRATLSQSVMSYGEPHQVFRSISMTGKNRGAMRFEFSEPHRLLIERGFSPESGFLERVPYEGKAKKKDSLDKIAQRISKEPGKVDADQIKKDLLEPWLVSTMSTPASKQLQKVAARTFGHSEPRELKDLKIDWDLLMPMGGIYNLTQDALKKQGFKETQRIPIYRPWSPKESGAKDFEKGDEVRIKLNPLTSWTTNINEALVFAEFLGSPTKPAYVIKTYIPIKSIVSTPHTGFGMPGTQEVIPAGGEYEALVEVRFG